MIYSYKNKNLRGVVDSLISNTNSEIKSIGLNLNNNHKTNFEI